jgi:hypothetical protein
MPRKIQHNQCECGNKKQITSEICRLCYINKMNSLKIIHKCSKCNVEISKSSKHSRCINCYRDDIRNNLIQKDETIGQFKYKNSKNPNHFVKIRQHARRIAEIHGLLDNGCSICSFPFVDVCHIKPIKEWEDDSLMSDVNDTENLIILCKNCHWLFDHGYNSIELIKNFYINNQ